MAPPKASRPATAQTASEPRKVVPHPGENTFDAIKIEGKAQTRDRGMVDGSGWQALRRLDRERARSDRRAHYLHFARAVLHRRSLDKRSKAACVSVAAAARPDQARASQPLRLDVRVWGRRGSRHRGGGR